MLTNDFFNMLEAFMLSVTNPRVISIEIEYDFLISSFFKIKAEIVSFTVATVTFESCRIPQSECELANERYTKFSKEFIDSVY